MPVGILLQILQIRKRNIIFQIIPSKIVVDDAVGFGDGLFVQDLCSAPMVPAMMGFAFFLPLLALPWIWGTGKTSFFL